MQGERQTRGNPQSRRRGEPMRARSVSVTLDSAVTHSTGLNWRRFLLSWFALPASAIAALLVGAIMIAALGANPVTGYHALASGAFGSGYALEQHRGQGDPAAARRCRHLHRLPRERLQHRRRGPDRDGRPRGDRRPRSSCPNLPARRPDPARAARRSGRRRRSGARSPGVFKAYFNVNEILSTIMLNLVAVQLMNYLLAGPLVDKSAGLGRRPHPADAAAARRTRGCRS